MQACTATTSTKLGFECFLPPMLRSFLLRGLRRFHRAWCTRIREKIHYVWARVLGKLGHEHPSQLEGIEEEGEEIVSRPGTAQSRPGTARATLSREQMPIRPASRQSVASSRCLQCSQIFQATPLPWQLWKQQNIPDGDDTDGVFPRSIRHIYREANRRLIQEQTVIEVYYQLWQCARMTHALTTYLGLNPTEPKSMRWNPKRTFGQKIWLCWGVATSRAVWTPLLRSAIIPFFCKCLTVQWYSWCNAQSVG